MRSSAQLLTGALVIAAVAGSVRGQISGRPVAELAQLDTMMTNFMSDNAITAGVMGIMKDGRIVYLRGFGLDYGAAPLPENALFRIASCTKPVTAAAVQDLIADEAFTKDARAFDVGQPGGGVLPVNPWPFLSDPRIQNITIDHLLQHRGGWDRDEVGDWTYWELNIAGLMGISSPPGRTNTLRWILGMSLQFDPGTEYQYSNIGYLSLGLAVEHVSGQSLLGYLRQHILTPQMWVPSTELQMGATFREWQDAREPFYNNLETATNVYDNYGPSTVLRPYGGWDHEARTGQGRIVASAATMLEFAERYRVGISGDIGKPRGRAPLSSDESHGGSLGGLNSNIYQRTDGINVFIAFNKDGSSNYATAFRDSVADFLNSNTIDVPRTSDGFWTHPSGGSGGLGGYHRPFGSFAAAMALTGSGSKVRMKPGTTNWTGTISKRLLIDAPLGAVTIGQQ